MTDITGLGGRVLRFEFSGPLIERLNDFVIVHNYDDRNTYKEAWTAWLAHHEIAALIQAEVARLNALGYTGDVVDKLFKSGRYYFRDKAKTKASEEAKTEKDNNNLHRKY